MANLRRGCRGALYMRPGRHPRNCGCHGRIYNPPLQGARWKFVGVDVLIDPTAKRPSADGRLGEPPLQARWNIAVHLVGADLRSTRGRLREPPLQARRNIAVHLVGVDVRIDPCREAPLTANFIAQFSSNCRADRESLRTIGCRRGVCHVCPLFWGILWHNM